MQYDHSHDIGSWPKEILLSLFRNFEDESIGPSALVCRSWFQMSKDNELWRQRCADKWSDLPKEKYCKRSWLIPMKERGVCIDWQRYYILQSTLPSLIQVLKRLYDQFNDNETHFMKKSDRAALKSLIHQLQRGLKLSLRSGQIQQLITYFSEYYYLALRLKEEEGYKDFLRQLEDVTKFFLTLELAIIAGSTAAHLKKAGIGIYYFKRVREELSRPSLRRFIVQYAREFIYQVEKKALSYTDAFDLIHIIATIFFDSSTISPETNSADPAVVDLGFDVLHLIVYALLNWPIEAEVIFSTSFSLLLDISVMFYTYIRCVGSTYFEYLHRIIKPIYPPKTPRESLVVVFIASNFICFEERQKLDEWLLTLPTPMGSEKDKNLILYYYQVLSEAGISNNLVSTAIDFLLNVVLELPYSWQVMVLQQLSKKRLSPAQEEVLFQKIKTLGEKPGWRNLADKWTAQFAISCDKISEYKELVVNHLETSLCYFESCFENGNLLDLVLEEYEKRPRESLEWLLLGFVNALKFKILPFNLALISIPLIGKRIALIRALDIEKDETSANQPWNANLGDNGDDNMDEELPEVDDMDLGKESLSDEEEDLSLEGSNVVGRYKASNRSNWLLNNIQDLSVMDLISLLTQVVRNLSADVVKQHVPQLLEIVKTEFNNRKIWEFYFGLIDRLTAEDAKVADDIATSLVQCIRANNQRGRQLRCTEMHAALYRLYSSCSNKDFLPQDVITKLCGWIVDALDGFERIDLWPFLLAKLEDRTDAVQQMFDKLDDYAEDGDSYENYIATASMTMLLESGAFKLTDALLPLLPQILWINHESDSNGISIHEKMKFLGAAVKHSRAFVKDILPAALDLLEKDCLPEDIMTYVVVIDLIDDEDTWAVHMETLIKRFSPPNNFFELFHAESRLVLYRLFVQSKKLFAYRKSIPRLWQEIQNLIGDKESVGVGQEKVIIDGLIDYYRTLSELGNEEGFGSDD